MRKGFFIMDDEDDLEDTLTHRRVILTSLASLISLLGVFSLVMMIIQLFNQDGSSLNFNLFFYPIQGYLIQSCLIAGYSFVYWKLRRYYRWLMLNYDKLFTKAEMREIARANKEICKFFSYICQFMVTYMIYATLKLSISETHQSQSVVDRVYDIVDIFLTFSYLLMLYGISDSV